MTGTVQQALQEGARLRQQCCTLLDEPLRTAAALMCESLQGGGKVLACGNGGSAADAQHFAAELVNRFEIDRPALAALALTTDTSVVTSIANDISFRQLFARQVQALGRPGDVLLAISTSGSSDNVIDAVDAATATDIKVIALTGRDGGALGRHAGVDIHLHIPSDSTPRVQEMHITCLHILCSLIDKSMFGDAQ